MLKAVASLLLALSIVGVPASAVHAADSWLMQGHDAQATNFNPGDTAISPQNVARLRTAWTYPGVVKAIATGKRVFAIVAAGQSHLNVVVLDSRTGRLLRRFTAAMLHLSGQPYDNPIDLAYGQGKLVIAGVSSVLAVDPQTGRQYWRTPGGAGAVAIAGGTIYTGKTCQNSCGAMISYALNLATGAVRWQHRENGGGRPILIASRLYQLWGQYTPETRVYDPASGFLVARMPMAAWWTGDSHSAYATVGAVGGKSGWAGQVSSTGRPRWKVTLGKVSGTTAPVLAYHNLYVASNRFSPGLLALNASNGQVRWAADLGSNLTAIAANHLIFVLHASSGLVDILHAGSGQTAGRVRIRNYSPTGFIPGMFLSAGTLYIHDGKRLHALRASPRLASPSPPR